MTPRGQAGKRGVHWGDSGVLAPENEKYLVQVVSNGQKAKKKGSRSLERVLGGQIGANPE